MAKGVLKRFSDKVRELGGEAFLVGGCVRDKLRGAEPRDKDIAVTGVTLEDFQAAFPRAKLVGKTFPVFRLWLGAAPSEIALARREAKSGPGHTGFEVEYDPAVTIEEDLFRRDITINAMARSIHTGRMIDPYGGERDIKARKIRALSDKFVDDPLRALRAARLSAAFEYDITPDTLELMRRCGPTLCELSPNRIYAELEKAVEADRPSLFFRALHRADILREAFPFIADMIGKSQPEPHHPEGDAFEHSMIVADKVAALTSDPAARFAALMHDVGKGATPPEMLPHHYGHEERGAKIAAALPCACRKAWRLAAEVAARHHMRALKLKSPGKIADLLGDLARAKFPPEFLDLIIFADKGKHVWFLGEEASGKILGVRPPIPAELQTGGAENAAKIKVLIRDARVKAAAALIARR